MQKSKLPMLQRRRLKLPHRQFDLAHFSRIFKLQWRTLFSHSLQPQGCVFHLREQQARRLPSTSLLFIACPSLSSTLFLSLLLCPRIPAPCPHPEHKDGPFVSAQEDVGCGECGGGGGGEDHRPPSSCAILSPPSRCVVRLLAPCRAQLFAARPSSIINHVFRWRIIGRLLQPL